MNEETPRPRATKRYPGSIDRRGDSYRVRLSIGGERFRFTIPTTDRRAAERFAREKARELMARHQRVALGLPEGVRVSGLLARFERDELPGRAPGTRAAYHDSLKPIRAYFLGELGDPLLERVRAADVAAFLTWRRTHRLDGDAPVSNRTLQKDRAVLHRLFAIAERLELRDGNPVARVQPPPADRRTPVLLTDAQYEKLLAACAERPMLELYVLVLGEAGLRCESEALWLQFEDVDLEGGYLWVASGRAGHRTKGGKGRWVPMTPRLLAALRAHFAAYRFATYGAERSPWIFHHERSRRNATAGARLGSLRHAFGAAAMRAKLPPELHQHDLRHRRVTSWLAGGANPVHVKEAVGHADLRTTMDYTHLAREHLKSLVTPPPAEPDHQAGERRA